MMLPAPVQIDNDAVARLCHKYGAARLCLFGSVLRSDFDPARSDIDILVEFLPGEHKGLFKLLEMQRALTQLLGRSVDLTTPLSLSKYFRDDVLANARVLYDAA
jgi:predicted nucleotidyltransferase